MEIVIESLTHVYHAQTPYEMRALDRVDLRISSGEFVSLIGPTGSGKSTLVQHLNGMLRPTSGKVTIGDVEITPQKKELRFLRKKVGIVFQYPEHQLFEETVEADIAFGPRQFGLPEREVESRVKKAMRMVGLSFDAFAKRSPFRLSGGQRRRAAIAGVLALEPEVLVLDEPTVGLDPKGQQDIMSLVERMHREKKLTTILVSHQMDDVARYSDRVVVLDKGKVKAEGPPGTLFSKVNLLRSVGLDVPEITRLILQLNRRVHPPIPTDIFDMESLVKELEKRKKASEGAMS